MQKKIEQKRFQIINDAMKTKSVQKTQFAGLNDKSYYLHDGIVSLPYGHFIFEKVRKEKDQYRNKLHFEATKTNRFFELENKAVNLCERLRVIRSIFSQPPRLYQPNHNAVVAHFGNKSTRKLIQNGSWK